MTQLNMCVDCKGSGTCNEDSPCLTCLGSGGTLVLKISYGEWKLIKNITRQAREDLVFNNNSVAAFLKIKWLEEILERNEENELQGNS